MPNAANSSLFTDVIIDVASMYDSPSSIGTLLEDSGIPLGLQPRMSTGSVEYWHDHFHGRLAQGQLIGKFDGTLRRLHLGFWVKVLEEVFEDYPALDGTARASGNRLLSELKKQPLPEYEVLPPLTTHRAADEVFSPAELMVVGQTFQTSSDVQATLSDIGIARALQPTWAPGLSSVEHWIRIGQKLTGELGAHYDRTAKDWRRLLIELARQERPYSEDFRAMQP